MHEASDLSQSLCNLDQSSFLILRVQLWLRCNIITFHTQWNINWLTSKKKTNYFLPYLKLAPIPPSPINKKMHISKSYVNIKKLGKSQFQKNHWNFNQTVCRKGAPLPG